MVSIQQKFYILISLSMIDAVVLNSWKMSMPYYSLPVSSLFLTSLPMSFVRYVDQTCYFIKVFTFYPFFPVPILILLFTSLPKRLVPFTD